MQIQCKVVTDGVRCPTTLTIDGATETTSYTCRNHPRAVQVRANKRTYDPVKDEADKRIHFQDVAWDPELGGRVKPTVFEIESDDISDLIGE